MWLVALDTERLKASLRGPSAHAAESAIASAAAAADVRLIDACVLPFGVRAILVAPSARSVRAFARRFVALAASSGAHGRLWRPAYRATPFEAQRLPQWQAYLRRCRTAATERNDDMLKQMKVRAGAAPRRGAMILKTIEAALDAALGRNEVATRLRRYAAEHDPPPDDRSAFERLCLVVFAQGLSFGVVENHREALSAAFCDFDPARVASFDDAAVGRLMTAPIIRNESKVRACVENARRWITAAHSGTYLGRVAGVAAEDDAAAGWPKLTRVLVADFSRFGQTAARQTLKRWGFFTAFAHPGAHRVLERLGLADTACEPPRLQLLIGAIAEVAGRDPYMVEAALALFATIGPCRIQPRCHQCALVERCPAPFRP